MQIVWSIESNSLSSFGRARLTMPAIYCSVYGCVNNSKKLSSLSFFRMPKAEDR